MPYLIQGSSRQLAQIFNTHWLVQSGDKEYEAETIEKDLPRTFFLGTRGQAQQHLKMWRESTNKEYYTQGNICATNSFLLLGHVQLFKKEYESDEEYQLNSVRNAFAYVNKEQELCGLIFFYRRDNPSEWLIAATKNNASSPDKRQVTLLANFDLNPFVINAQDRIKVEVVDRLYNKLFDQVDCLFVKQLLEYALQDDTGEINTKYERSSQLLRMLDLDDGSQLIEDPVAFEQLSLQKVLAEPLLDLINQHHMLLSSKMLLDCISDASGLRKEVDSLVWTEHPELNKCLLNMTIDFYEKGILEPYRAVLQEQLFNKTYENSICWNQEQIKLVPFLISNAYSPELLQLILSKRAYYNALSDLDELGFTEDAPDFFTKPNKLKELEYLDVIQSKSLKKLTLIFWIKGQLTNAEYQQIIDEAPEYPLMADTLIALDKTGEISIPDLKALAINPQQHSQQSIIHHFSKAFPVNKGILNKLDTGELKRLNQAFLVLKHKKNVTEFLYDVVARDNKQGQLLRLFLPSFSSVIKQEHLNVLIDLLYLGVQSGPILQGEAVSAIKDENLHELAVNLHERFICARQMQRLNFLDEMISFAADPVDPRSSRLRRIILNVEAQCKEIHQDLSGFYANKKQKEGWECVEQEYRKTLYAIAYDAIKDPSFDFKPVLAKQHNKLVNIVDPEIKSWLYQALIIIANVFITALSLGIANEIKFKKTGNYWFFNQTRPGERLSALEKDFTDCVRP